MSCNIPRYTVRGGVFSLKSVVMYPLIKRIEFVIKTFPTKGVHNKACIATYKHVLSMISDYEPKIFEVHGSFGGCFVCAFDEEHAKEIIAKDEDKPVSEITFSDGQEIPKQLYTSFNMEREGEEGTEILTFHTYMKEVRMSSEYEIICKIAAE